MRVLITGVTGFVGSHLAEHLLAATDWEITGLSRTLDHVKNVEGLLPRLRLQVADCGDREALGRVVASVRPEAVFHLAGQALESISWQNPAATFMQNVAAEINLFEALRHAEPRPRTLIVGSGLAYGLVKPDENPISEAQPPRPASPYAVSKIAADYLGYQYFVSYQLPVLRLRPFNQLGPRQQSSFAIPAFARQIAAIERGEVEPLLRTGNLTAVRDFTDVRDAAVAYRLALEHGTPGEAYNLGTGTGHTMRSLLERLVNLSSATIRIEQAPELLRPLDVPHIVADASKLKAQTGWQPAIDIDQSLRDTLNYWRTETG
ncbi:MAG TPA: GDP-mannose 4,6-dehydratase [Chloroflexota bacterium]|nr:GDP-mannose 4,6-dehydratase [Chloroflexota bacterium]